MAKRRWNEAGRTWEADHGLLDDDQIAKCVRADEGTIFASPIPTRMISNGEYMPALQTQRQAQVESRIAELAGEPLSTKLKTILEFPGYTNDKMAAVRQEYEEAGAQPSRTRYGWIRAKA